MYETWPDEKVAEIEEAWRSGAMSARQIAIAFETTRSAVLGLAYRKGWPARAPGRRLEAPAVRSTLSGNWRPDSCQWIEGPARGGKKCGGAIARPNGAYCAEHQRRAVRRQARC